MKFTTYTTFPEQTSNESLWVLVDSEQLQTNLNTYQINNIENILTATQFKATSTKRCHCLVSLLIKLIPNYLV